MLWPPSDFSTCHRMDANFSGPLQSLFVRFLMASIHPARGSSLSSSRLSVYLTWREGDFPCKVAVFPTVWMQRSSDPIIPLCPFFNGQDNSGRESSLSSSGLSVYLTWRGGGTFLSVRGAWKGCVRLQWFKICTRYNFGFSTLSPIKSHVDFARVLLSNYPYVCFDLSSSWLFRQAR